MSEFGHVGIIGENFCLDAWGAGPFMIEAKGQSFRFEDSDRFGPSLVKQNGDISANPWPPERSPFWPAWDAWRKQGRRIAPDGRTCIYEPLNLRPTKWRRIGRRNVIVEHGDEGGGYVEVTEYGGPA